MNLQVTPMPAALGARVEGVDTSGPLDDATIGRVRDALHTYGVIVLPGQRLTPDGLRAFGNRFGPLKVLPFGNNLPGYPEVGIISNIKENGQYIGSYDGGRFWHTDGSYVPKPHRMSFLYGIKIPMQNGEPLGDTLFASTTKAYQTLPAALRERIAGLHGVFSLASRYQRKAIEVGSAVSERHMLHAGEPVRHPIVRPHPDTGRPCLYVNEGYTEGIAELPADEAQELLAELFAHTIRPEHLYRHRWTENDLVIWDNCLTIHRATFDYPPDAPRLMHRVMVAGY